MSQKKYVLAVLMLTVSAQVLSATDLSEYKAIYEKEIAGISAEYATEIIELNASYENSLKAFRARATGVGDLDSIKAAMAESERFAGSQSVTEADGAAGAAGIRSLQEIYIKKLHRLKFSKAGSIAALCSKYDSALLRHQTSLAKESRIDEASAVKEERARVANGESLVAAKGLLLVTKAQNASPKNHDGAKAPQPKQKKVLAAALEKDLLLHYTFDDLRGRKVEDESGKRNHGSSLGAPKRMPGTRGLALALDGKKDMIIAQARNADLADAYQSGYTLALWFKPLSKPNNDERNGPSALLVKAGCDVGLFYTPEETFAMDTWLTLKANASPTNRDGGTYITTRSTQVSLDKEWVHVVGVVSDKAGSIGLYLNGELMKETIWPHDWKARRNDSPWRIGMANIGRCMANGVFDDVRIYSRSLSADEIQKLHETTAPKR